MPEDGVGCVEVSYEECGCAAVEDGGKVIGWEGGLAGGVIEGDEGNFTFVGLKGHRQYKFIVQLGMDTVFYGIPN